MGPLRSSSTRFLRGIYFLQGKKLVERRYIYVVSTERPANGCTDETKNIDTPREPKS